MAAKTLYCVCKTEYQQDEFMIECDKCKDWFHGRCVGIEESESQHIDIYHCPPCVKLHGPLTLKRKRSMQMHNLQAHSHGMKPIHAGTMDFIRLLKTKKFADVQDNIIVLENGHLFNIELVEKSGFKEPILVQSSEGLDIVVPPSNFTVYDVEQHVGSLHEIHVIDVARQEDMRMRMREWTEYYNCPIRTKVLNVISLEFSNTKLSSLVSPPSVVRNISWVENVWPEAANDDSPHTMPYVQKYCLMGVKDCYTDFHVDFGGTSVWYHVLRGEKIFYLIEPSDENLAKYENWVSSSNQSQIFFGDRVNTCIKCSVKQGQTLFIPTGWIHAVMTPVDTLVFGGNFLNSLNIGLQLKIYDLEQRLNTPIKFLFPNYETTCWYTARTILKKIKEFHAIGKRIPTFLLKGTMELVRYLKMWTYNKEDFIKFHKFQVPLEINPLKLIKALDKEIKHDMSTMEPPLSSALNLSGVSMFDVKNDNNKVEKKKSKTIIKLKLTGPNPNTEEELSYEKRIKKIKKKKVELSKKKRAKEKTNVKEGDGKNLKRHRNKMRKGNEYPNNGSKNEYPNNDKRASIQAADEKVLSRIESVRNDHLIPSNATSSHVDPSHSESVRFEYQDWEAAQLLSNFHGMDTSMRKKSNIEIPTIKTPRQRVENPVAKLQNADILKNEEHSGDEYQIMIPLAKPKGNVKRNFSESDSDYDPTEEYYQDANFVYPRLESTADLDGDDFAWNPGQRKRKRLKKHPTSKLNSHSNKRKSADEVSLGITDRFETEMIRTNKLQNKFPTTAGKQESDRRKDKFKRRNSTAKQRLGKLLKLDKLGGRYVR